MNLSVIIPFRRESAHRERVFETVKARWISQFPACEILVADNPGEFSRSKSRNLGASVAHYEMLAFSDADTICNKDFLKTAFDLACESPWAFPYRVYYNLNEAKTNETLSRLTGSRRGTALERPLIDECEHAIPSCGGIFFILRENFEKIGGYDEGFKGWGYEDNAFALAADCIIGKHQTVPGGWVAHLWHEAPEDVRFGQPHIANNRRRYRQYEMTTDPVEMRRIRDE